MRLTQRNKTVILIWSVGRGQTVQFINSATDTPNNFVPIPGTYVFVPTANQSLRIAYLGGGEEELPFNAVRRIMTDNALSLRNAGFDVSVPEIRAYGNNYPFGLRVSAEEIAAGFYRELYGLQGHQRTYYSGAAFHAHDWGALWRFTERVIQEYGLAG